MLLNLPYVCPYLKIRDKHYKWKTVINRIIKLETFCACLTASNICNVRTYILTHIRTSYIHTYIHTHTHTYIRTYILIYVPPHFHQFFTLYYHVDKIVSIFQSCTRSLLTKEIIIIILFIQSLARKWNKTKCFMSNSRFQRVLSLRRTRQNVFK